MQLRFGGAMSFDNRLIAASCTGGAWSLGEAHSRNERLWNGRLWPQVDIRSRFPCGYFLHICLDRTSNLATGLSVCQSSTSWPSTSRLAYLMADSSSIQSS